MHIHRWNPEDGPPTEAALRKRLEALGYACTTYVYTKGTSFPEHTHTVDKMDAVVSGTFRLIIEGQEAVLRPGDAVAVPRGVRHSAEVVGSEPVVSIDGVRRR